MSSSHGQRPTASFADGKVWVFVGYMSAKMELEGAERLYEHLGAAIEAMKAAAEPAKP